MTNKLLPLTIGTLAAVSILHAGGFWLETANPQANPEARAANAVLVVRVVGCHNPEQADVTATAVGMVDGKRISTPLKLVKLSTPGAYALSRQWPAQGRWALEVVAVSGERVTSAVLPATGDDVPRNEAKNFAGRPPAEQVNAMLASR